MPRCVRNQRVATVAPRTPPTAPVPTPTMRPQNRNSCHSWVIHSIGRSPAAINAQPAIASRRGPNRSIRPPASGAAKP